MHVVVYTDHEEINSSRQIFGPGVTRPGSTVGGFVSIQIVTSAWKLVGKRGTSTRQVASDSLFGGLGLQKR